MSSGGNGDEDPLRTAPTTVKKKAGQGDGGSGAGGIPNECNITEETKVNSPNRTVASTLRAGDVLALEYNSGPPKQLLVKTTSSAVLGSITSNLMPQYIQCILAGVKYNVIILSISGGLIDVRIEPA